MLYQYCQDQVIMGQSGPVALNGMFIKEAMREYQIDDDEHVLFSSTVRRIARIVFNARQEELQQRLSRKK